MTLLDQARAERDAANGQAARLAADLVEARRVATTAQEFTRDAQARVGTLAAELAVVRDENAQLRRLVARVRRDLGRITSPHTPVLDTRDIARGALGEIAAGLAELDPPAGDDDRPVVTLALPEPQCITCGDTGYVKPRAGHPYQTCTCPAGAALAQADQEST